MSYYVAYIMYELRSNNFCFSNSNLHLMFFIVYPQSIQILLNSMDHSKLSHGTRNVVSWVAYPSNLVDNAVLDSMWHYVQLRAADWRMKAQT